MVKKKRKRPKTKKKKKRNKPSSYLEAKRKQAEITISYFESRPWSAKLVDPVHDQCVKISTRADAVEEWTVDATKRILQDVNRLNEKLAPYQRSGAAKQAVKLKDIFFDKYGSFMMTVELLHDYREEPLVTKEQLKRFFHDQGEYTGAGSPLEYLIALVDVKITLVGLIDEDDEIYEDEYYW